MCGELSALPEGVQRVARELREKGHPHAPVMLDDAARTAQQAADALGIAVGQIAKSIIFRRKSDDAAVLVIASGDRRVDEKKVDALIGKTGRADAEFVKAKTGYSIGGVSPVAHTQPPVTLIDRELFRFEELGRGRAPARRLQAASKRSRTADRRTGGRCGETVGLMSAMKLLAERARTVAAGATQDVPSPCISVCRMHAASELCEGCLRTMYEIAAWSGMDDEDKKQVWAQIARRIEESKT
jgi:prolyl-tRNA editing enzyme YbaK/EbsC (Cys-tRNA(Pro) deacylase)/predicted Fe-S protein YdhL (DUF1289 family)